LDPALFGTLPTRLAYLFLTDCDFERTYPDTADPERGESALILQPGRSWRGPSQPLYEGPRLYRGFHRDGRWEQEPCEFEVELRKGDDPDVDT
jgi:hypothetical protein